MPQCMLPLQKGKEACLLIWPHSLQTDAPVNPRGKQELKFIRESKEARKTLLELKIDREGEFHANCSALLYIANLFQAKGDMKRASFYLQKAINARLGTPAEREIFNDVSLQINRLPQRNMRQIAFKLKAELAISKIRRQQTQELSYDPKDLSSFAKRVQQFAELYEIYLKKLEKIRVKHPQLLLEEELELTSEERFEFEKIRAESIRFLLTAPPTHAINLPPAFSIKLFTNEKELSQEFLQHLVVHMADPKATPPEDIQSIVSLNPENVLKYFWNYFIQIREQQLKPSDLPLLISATIDGQKPEDKAVTAHLELARRLLLTIAQTNAIPALSANPLMRNVPSKASDLNKLYKRKKALPKKEAESNPGTLSMLHTALTGGDHMKIMYAQESIHNSIYLHLKRLSYVMNYQPEDLKTVLLPMTEQQLAPKKKEEATTSFKAIIEDIKNGKSQLSPEEQGQIKLLAERYINDAPEEINAPRTLQNAVMILSGMGGINLIESRRTDALEDRIAYREEKLRKAAQNPVKPFSMYAEVTVPNLEENGIENYPFFDSVPQLSQEELQKQAMSLSTLTVEDPALTPMEQNENAQLKLGLDKAMTALQQQNLEMRTLPFQNKQTLAAALKTRLEQLESLNKQRRNAILEWANSQKAPYILNKMILDQEICGEAEIVEKTLDLYQRGRLGRGEDVEDQAICSEITQFLLEATEFQQLEIALSKLEKLEEIEDERQYNSRADEIYQTIKAGTNQRRYLEKDKLANPAYTRKYLTAEYRSRKIWRAAQTGMVEKIMQDPTRLAQLIMGAGKTSFIMPILMQLFAEQGALAFALVTQELLRMNPIDQTTRELFRQASMQFDFTIDAPASCAYLAEQYDRLLQAKEEEGYVIGAIESLAALENKLTRVADQQLKLVQALDAVGLEAGDPSKLMEILQLQKQKYWLIKIKSLFDHSPEKVKKRGFETQFFADEGDEIFNILREINNALGMRDPDYRINEVIYKLICFVMRRKETDNSDATKTALSDDEHQILITLQQALKHNKQAALTKEFLKDAMRAIAKMTFHEFLVKEKGINNIDLDQWIAFVTGVDKAKLDNMPMDPEIRNRISAIKRILSGTLSQVLAKNLGIDMGFSEKTGCVVVPCQNKVEKPNTQFGDEYELVACHNVMYAAQAPSDQFLDYCLKRLLTQDPDLHHQIELEAQTLGLQIKEYLKSPEAWDQRLALHKRFVNDAGYLKLSEEQITLSVHDVIRGRKCGVTSGTVNPASLPDGFNADLCQEGARLVEAETYLRIAQGGLGVKRIPDDQMLENMQQALTDPELRSIINQGVAMEGSTLDAIVRLRTSPEGSDRQFIFIDPLLRTAFIWNPKEKNPIPFDEKLVDPKKCLFFFNPADTRGTDFKIPYGNNVLISGATTLQPDYAQAAFRLRALGPNQRVQCWILESVADRIKSTQGVNIEDIQLGHVLDDIKRKTLEEQAMLNYKAAMKHVQGIMFTGLRNMAFADIPKGKEYWDMSNKENQKILTADIMADNCLFGISRGFMIQSRAVDFEGDLKATKQENALDKIEKSYGENLVLLGQIRGKLRMIKSAEGIKRIEGLGEQAVKHYLERLEEADKVITTISEELTKARQTFKNKKEELRKNLPDKVSSGASSQKNALVQMQQQQQQQQQIQSVESGPPPSDESHEYQRPRFMELAVELDGNVLNVAEGLPFAECGLEEEGLHITREVSELYRHMPRATGEPLARLAIIKLKGQKKHCVCLIGKLDYHIAFQQAKKDGLTDAAVYAINTEPVIDAGQPLGLLSVEQGSVKWDDQLVRQCAIARLLMGCNNFTVTERNALKSWIKALPDSAHIKLIAALQKKGNPQSVSLLASLKNS